MDSVWGELSALQGYLAHKKQRRPTPLQLGCTLGRMVDLGRWAVSYERGTPANPEPKTGSFHHQARLLRNGLENVTFTGRRLQTAS